MRRRSGGIPRMPLVTMPRQGVLSRHECPRSNLSGICPVRTLNLVPYPHRSIPRSKGLTRCIPSTLFQYAFLRVDWRLGFVSPITAMSCADIDLGGRRALFALRPFASRLFISVYLRSSAAKGLFPSPLTFVPAMGTLSRIHPSLSMNFSFQRTDRSPLGAASL